VQPVQEDAELALGSILVKSTSAEMGDNEGNLDAVVEGDDTQIAFNGRYLRDALEASTHPRCSYRSPAQLASIIRPAGEPNGYLHVIMPMHVAR